MNIVLAGPPKAGKSVVANTLYRTLQERKVKFFLERLHPDCEGVWTNNTNNHLAKKYKQVIKSNNNFFCESFVRYKIMSIRNLSKLFDIVIYDLGGIPSQENRLFIETILDTGLTIAVLLYSFESNQEVVNDWKNFLQQFKTLNLLVLPTCWNVNDIYSEAVKYVRDILEFTEFVQNVFAV